MVEEFLDSDHESLGLLLEALKRSLPSRDFARTYELLDLFWARLAMHIRAEHLCLFPAIENARPELFGQGDIPSLDEVNETIATLRLDHNFFMDELARAVQIMRTLSSEKPQDMESQVEVVRGIVAEVEKRLEEHNKSEEEDVYLWPARLLNESESSRLDAEIQRQITNLPPRFSKAR
jgi:hemerythrin superfamily protein